MESILTRTECIELEDSGIICCTALEGSYLSYQDGLENLKAVESLKTTSRVPVLVDIRKSKGASKECRALFASDEASRIQSACALIIESPLSSLVGNFFLGLNKPKFPLRLFTDISEARKWLQTFL